MTRRTWHANLGAEGRGPAIEVDTTGDGIADAVGYDTTGDGKVDAIDSTGDGMVDAYDTNGDGRFDTAIAAASGVTTARLKLSVSK